MELLFDITVLFPEMAFSANLSFVLIFLMKKFLF